MVAELNTFLWVMGIASVIGIIAAIIIKKLIALAFGIAFWIVKTAFSLLLLPFSLLINAIH